MSKLYRGVNKTLDSKNGGNLLPKGKTVKVVPLHDGKIKYDGTFVAGACESNTTRAKQIDNGLYDGCGISTSRSEDIAINFATSGNMEDGFVYVIDENKLIQEGVNPYEFSNPENPHEEEVTLIEKSGGALPHSIILEKYEVSSDGKRT